MNTSFDDRFGTAERKQALVRSSIIDVAPPVPIVDLAEPNALLNYLGIIRRNILWIVLFAMFGLFAGFCTFIVRPRLYASVSTMELTGINESFMNMSAVDPQAGTGTYSANGLTITTQLRILESGAIRGPVIERLDRELTPMADPQPDTFTKLRGRLGFGNRDPLQSMKQSIQTAVITFHARVLPGTRILSLSCESTNPEVAAAFLNTLASEYISQNLQYRSSSAQKTTQWLSGQLEETKVKLEEAEKKLQEFVQKSGNTFIGDADTLATSKMKLLQTELAASQTDRINKQTRFEMAKSSPPDALPEVLDDGTLRNYHIKIADLRREMAMLTTTLTPENYKVKKVTAQLAELESTLQRERGNLIRKITNEYEQARKRESLLQAAYSGQSRAVSDQSSKAVEYGLLKREVDMMRQSLNVMLQQVNQSVVVSAVPTSNLRIIDPATPAQIPGEPVMSSHLTYGLFGGTAFGIGLTLLIEAVRKHKRDQKVHVSSHASNLLRLPELGVIPSAEAERTGWKPRMHTLKRWKRKEEDAKSPLALITWNERTSLLADSFRFVLASMKLMEGTGRQRAQVVVVVSPLSGEGKTTVVSNVGIAMAEAGRRTIIIDADLRNPRMHDIFNMPNAKGFHDLIASENALNQDVLQSTIQRTSIPGLSIISAGILNAGDINRVFHSPQVPELLEMLRQDYDTILIDTPPLLLFSDARLISFVSDGVVMVLRSGITDRESAVAARTRLAEDGIRIFGIILNDWAPRGDNRYHNGYQYHMSHKEQRS